MYWLLSTNNKLFIYKAILKPIWTYGIQLWGTTSNSDIDIGTVVCWPSFVYVSYIHKRRSGYTTQVNLRKQTYLRSNNIEIAVSLRTIAKYQIRRTQH
jgi:hypothetical protein